MGPTVCELEGPMPMVNMSKTLITAWWKHGPARDARRIELRDRRHSSDAQRGEHVGDERVRGEGPRGEGAVFVGERERERQGHRAAELGAEALPRDRGEGLRELQGERHTAQRRGAGARAQPSTGVVTTYSRHTTGRSA